MLEIVTKVAKEHARLSLSNLAETAPTKSMALVAVLSPPLDNGEVRDCLGGSCGYHIGDNLMGVAARGSTGFPLRSRGYVSAVGSSPIDLALPRPALSEISMRSGGASAKSDADHYLLERHSDLEVRTRSGPRNSHPSGGHLAAHVSEGMMASPASEADAEARGQPSGAWSGEATLATD